MRSILEIAQQLIDELEQQEKESRLRAEGVVLLYRRLQAEAAKETPATKEEE